MLKPALGSVSARNGTFQIPQIELGIERIQIVAVLKAVFLRVITKPAEMDALQMQGLLSCTFWRIDGVTPAFSCRNIESTVVNRRYRNSFFVRFGVDLFFPMNQPIDINLTKYKEPDFSKDFQADAGVVQNNLERIDLTPKHKIEKADKIEVEVKCPVKDIRPDDEL